MVFLEHGSIHSDPDCTRVEKKKKKKTDYHSPDFSGIHSLLR